MVESAAMLSVVPNCAFGPADLMLACSYSSQVDDGTLSVR